MSQESRLIARQSAVLFFILATPLVLLVGGLTACGVDNDADVGQPIEVMGILTSEGGDDCQTMMGEDGTLYSLVGELEVFEDGDLVRVNGNLANPAVCDVGTPIEIVDIESGEPVSAAEADFEPLEEVFIEGHLSDEGVECQAMVDLEGELYTLTGDTGSLANMGPGDAVRILGRQVDDSPCQQGTTIEIMEVSRGIDSGVETAEADEA